MAETVTTTISTFIEGRFPQARIEPGLDIFSLGFINSLFAMELVMFLEKTFGFTVPNEELHIESFRSVEAMAALVDRLSTPAVVG